MYMAIWWDKTKLLQSTSGHQENMLIKSKRGYMLTFFIRGSDVPKWDVHYTVNGEK